MKAKSSLTVDPKPILTHPLRNKMTAVYNKYINCGCAAFIDISMWNKFSDPNYYSVKIPPPPKR